jgi:hypothetical protein
VPAAEDSQAVVRPQVGLELRAVVDWQEVADPPVAVGRWVVVGQWVVAG